MLRNSFCFSLLLFAVVLSHPTLEIPGGDSFYLESVFNNDISQDGKEEVPLVKLRQLFGNPELIRRQFPRANVPQFMVELYNTVNEHNRENPFNAKVVRSFIDRGSSLPHYYSFNFTGLETNEAVIAAELHLHLEPAPLETVTPAIYPSAYYTIRVYQVLDEHQLHVPDSQKLVNNHRVGAHASGWQTIDVKEAVLSWTSGAPNLGLLVTVSNSFGDGVAANFSRGSERYGKQPILVLFTGNEEETSARENPVPHRHDQEHEREGIERRKREAMGSENGNLAETLTSMEIYERAQMREELSDATLERTIIPHRRSRSTLNVLSVTAPPPATTTCARQDLRIDVEKQKWDWVIAPKSFSANFCTGLCKSSESFAVEDPSRNMDYSCCNATKWSHLSLLYYDADDTVCFTKVPNIVIEECDCQCRQLEIEAD